MTVWEVALQFGNPFVPHIAEPKISPGDAVSDIEPVVVGAGYAGPGEGDRWTGQDTSLGGLVKVDWALAGDRATSRRRQLRRTLSMDGAHFAPVTR